MQRVMRLWFASSLVVACSSSDHQAQDAAGAVDAPRGVDGGSGSGSGSDPGSGAWPDFAPIFASAQTFTHEGCNTVSYGTTPSLGTNMIGRVNNNDVDPQGSGCVAPDQGNASLSWVRMDWAANQVDFQYRILDTGSNGSAGVVLAADSDAIVSAYDATIAPFEGEYWVAFECGLHSRPGGASSCAGPLMFDAATQRVAIDQTRLSIVVHGTCDPTSLICTSASVPKLFAHAGKLYMYWDRGLIDKHANIAYRNDQGYGSAFVGPNKPPEQARFFGTDNWGAEVAKDSAGRLRVVGQTGAILASDGSDSTLVLPDADTFQVLDVGGTLIATGGLKQAGSGSSALAISDSTCAAPLNNVRGCYRLFFAQSSSQDALASNAYQLIPSETGGIAALEAAAPRVPVELAPFTLTEGQSMPVGSDAVLAFGADGVLELDRGSAQLWAEGSGGCAGSGCTAKFQADANLVLRDGSGAVYFQTHSGDGGATGSATAQLELATVPPFVQIFSGVAGDPRLWATTANLGVGADGIPNLPQSYNRFVYRPDDGKTVLLGGQFNALVTGAPHLAQTITSTYEVWPTAFLAPVCDPTTQPFPAFVESSGQCVASP